MRATPSTLRPYLPPIPLTHAPAHIPNTCGKLWHARSSAVSHNTIPAANCGMPARQEPAKSDSAAFCSMSGRLLIHSTLAHRSNVTPLSWWERAGGEVRPHCHPIRYTPAL